MVIILTMFNASNKKIFYEVGFVANNENDKIEVINAIQKLEGEILREGNFSKIKLSYPIKKQRTGVFGYLHFFIKPENVSKLREMLKLNPAILRFLIIKLVKTQTESLPKAFVEAQSIAKKTDKVLSNKELEKKIKDLL